jgi:hypothetical protein
MRLVAFVALTLVGGGCSFLFVKPAATYGDRCSSSQALPIVDTFLFVGQVLGAAVDAARPASAYAGTPISRGGAIGINATAAVVHLSSAIYGFSEVSACREKEPTVVDTVERRRALQRRMRDFSATDLAPSAPSVAQVPPTADGGVAADGPAPRSPAAPPVRQRSDDE